jgi:hypothetical protein
MTQLDTAKRDVKEKKKSVEKRRKKLEKVKGKAKRKEEKKVRSLLPFLSMKTDSASSAGQRVVSIVVE